MKRVRYMSCCECGIERCEGQLECGVDSVGVAGRDEVEVQPSENRQNNSGQVLCGRGIDPVGDQRGLDLWQPVGDDRVGEPPILPATPTTSKSRELTTRCSTDRS